MATKRGISPYFDPIRDDLEHNHPQIILKDTEYIDINMFNQIVRGNELILSAECWSNVHPLLATIPVAWDYTLPYGLIYPKDPPKEVLQFIMAVGKVDES